jgi:hypothetical protein
LIRVLTGYRISRASQGLNKSDTAADGSSGTTLCRSRCMDRFEKVLNLANPATVSVDDIRRH